MQPVQFLAATILTRAAMALIHGLTLVFWIFLV